MRSVKDPIGRPNPQKTDFRPKTVSMRGELREFLVDTIANILVHDYEESQHVKDDTVAEGSLPNRIKEGRVIGFLRDLRNRE